MDFFIFYEIKDFTTNKGTHKFPPPPNFPAGKCSRKRKKVRWTGDFPIFPNDFKVFKDFKDLKEKERPESGRSFVVQSEDYQ